MQNDYPIISNVTRTPASPIEGCGFVGVSVSAGSTNYYSVVGTNLHNIVRVSWAPRNPSLIRFQMIPLFVYDGNILAKFGIAILENYSEMENRGGYISFQRYDDTMIQWPVVSYGNVNLPWKGALFGTREFET